MQRTNTSASSFESPQSIREWIKSNHHPVAKLLRSSFYQLRYWQCPKIPVVHKMLYGTHQLVNTFISNMMRIFYWTPLFASMCSNKPKRLYLYSGMPQLLGNLDLSIGNNTRISGLTTFTGRTASPTTPQLNIGSNVDISWQTTIAVGTEIIIGDNTRIAGRCFLAGYPGHPLDPHDRANGKPDTDEQAGPIILKKNVWLASGVSVMPGVTIGENTIVAAGSVVTKSLPANVLAGGVPAKVIRALSR